MISNLIHVIHRWALRTGGLYMQAVFIYKWYLIYGAALTLRGGGGDFDMRLALYTSVLYIQLIFIYKWSLHTGRFYIQVVFVGGFIVSCISFVKSVNLT